MRWFVKLAAGVAASLLVSFVLGCLAGAGPAAWPEFFRNIRMHNETVSANSVGVKSVVLMDAAVSTRHAVSGDLIGSITGWDRRMERVAARRRPVIVGASLAFTLKTIQGTWRAGWRSEWRWSSGSPPRAATTTSF